MAEKATTLSGEAARYRYWPGWTMLAFAALAQYLSAPGQSYSVAAFKDAMRSDLQLTETSFSMAYAVATICSAVLLPWIGRLVDSWGARVMLPLISLGLAIACGLMSQVTTLVGLYVAFCCVRSLGQGALSLVSVWMVGEWFERRRGMATAIAGLGGSVSVMTIPLLNNLLIERYSWEVAWMALGVATGVLLVIPAAWLVRDRPEDLGLRPDGWNGPEGSSGKVKLSKAPVVLDGESWSVSQAMADPTFWKLLAVPATSALVGTGLIFHQVRLLAGHGVSPAWALSLLTLQATVASIMIFPCGWLTDRLQSRLILLAAMCFLASAVGLLLMGVQGLAVIPYSILIGLHGAVIRSTGTVVWVNYYGRVHQGAIRGVAWAAMILAAAAGPLPLALSIDRYDSHRPALWLMLTLPVVAGLLISTAKPPRSLSPADAAQ